VLVAWLLATVVALLLTLATVVAPVVAAALGKRQAPRARRDACSATQDGLDVGGGHLKNSLLAHGGCKTVEDRDVWHFSLVVLI
jgi:hypothetical protein